MYAITDIETTGRDQWRNEIIQLCTILTDDNFNEVATFNEYIKPEREDYFDQRAFEVHGISWAASRKFKSQEDIFVRYNKFLYEHCPAGGLSFVCHALPFRSSVDLFDLNFIFSWYFTMDYRFLYYRYFPESKVISTIKKKRKQATTNYQIPNQKLGTWAKKLDFELKHHDALSDTRCCLEILKYQESLNG